MKHSLVKILLILIALQITASLAAQVDVAFTPTIKHRRGSLGVGYGLCYGGLGFNGDFNITDDIAATGSIGTFGYVGGYELGMKYFFLDFDKTFRPKLSAWYGVNALIVARPEVTSGLPKVTEAHKGFALGWVDSGCSVPANATVLMWISSISSAPPRPNASKSWNPRVTALSAKGAVSSFPLAIATRFRLWSHRHPGCGWGIFLREAGDLMEPQASCLGCGTTIFAECTIDMKISNSPAERTICLWVSYGKQDACRSISGRSCGAPGILPGVYSNYLCGVKNFAL